MNHFEHLRYEKQGAIAWIELNRPDDANGLDRQMAAELKQAALLCDRDPQLKVVVLTANGRFFCAGGDIKEMISHGDAIGDAIKSLADDLHGAISTLCRMQAALIVAVNGVAAGAGFSLALIGDIVLAAESSSFTMAYTRAGLCPDGSSSYFLPRLVGLRKAQELMLTNRSLGAAEARDIGLVTRVVADDELRAQAQQVASELAASARLSTTYVRKLLLASAGNDLETQMDLEAQLLSQCAASPDGREGIQAFVDKRKPEFN
ncbi:MAG: enoyl-CoA hydratase-related protein [Gammaproteobacteria bacterium]|nr:enoyl-CoA hydratase-related protein [Gammaproteobacteria bacterium]MDH3534496.1 enoyl-CoA hydratase-related protein [Gammaproteobacteria bacterium]